MTANTGIDPRAIATEVRLGAMNRENAATKGKRYLVEGRLMILHVGPSRVIARCRGTGVVHDLGFLNGRYFCSCAARSTCSHLHALQSVVSIAEGGNADGIPA